jgi:hypothetical protein
MNLGAVEMKTVRLKRSASMKRCSESKKKWRQKSKREER